MGERLQEVETTVTSDKLAHLMGFSENAESYRLPVTVKVVPTSIFTPGGAYQRPQGVCEFFRVPAAIAAQLKGGDLVTTDLGLKSADRHGLSAPVLEIVPIDEALDAEQLKVQEKGDGTWQFVKAIPARDTGQSRYNEQREAFMAERRHEAQMASMRAAVGA